MVHIRKTYMLKERERERERDEEREKHLRLQLCQFLGKIYASAAA
jgi:hypothetical protein